MNDYNAESELEHGYALDGFKLMELPRLLPNGLFAPTAGLAGRRAAAVILLAAVTIGVSVPLAAQPVQARVFEFEKSGGVEYRSGEDYRLTLDVYVPQAEGPLPAILAVHGGSWRSGTKLNWFRHARKIAAAGFVVVAINYRHAPRYPFPAQLEDCKAAVRWMRRNAATYQIDPRRIGAIGYSAGGHLVALLATTAEGDGLEGTMGGNEKGISTRLQAAAVGGAPLQFGWIDDDSGALDYFLGGSRAELPDVWRSATPATFLTADDPPMYLFHGRDDWIVPASEAETFYRQLQELGVESELELYDNGHFGLFSRLEAMDPVIEFFRRTLGPVPVARTD